MTAGTSNVPKWRPDAPNHAAHPHPPQLMFQIWVRRRCGMWTTVTPTTTSNLALKSWKECILELKKIWVSGIMGVVLTYGFGNHIIDQPSVWMKVALWGCQMPLYRVLSLWVSWVFIGTEVWMHLCSCCSAEETSGSLEAKALSNGPNSLRLAFKE